jgi:hypothetical protein
MDKTFRMFHYASFLQYPFLAAALFYSYKPIIIGIDNFNKTEIISNYNLVLLAFGIAFSFTSLADITKRTKLGDKIFGKPKNAKRWIICICMLILFTFALAIYTMFFPSDEKLKELSIGIFVFGIGMVGLLRMNLEIIKSYQPEWH